MLVRHLCVLRVSFWCLELCVFLFDCFLYAPWAQLRGALKDLIIIIIIIIIIMCFERSSLSLMYDQPGPFGNDSDVLDRNGGGKSGVSDQRLLISLSWPVGHNLATC